ncbi:antA/AntB antirepressor family protein [Fibrella forsythiae]|uniref:AntA/AntB antirepressor family protein n=1 Tax=Fibrella forsythiae TaxID=2817061 RepID=A0ABS3JTB2_9BACT|nr:antA/AntB antirepressor family protein [Fibrella forsythiae]MBO0953246.1 antA/AntB antirepressor family protein [Fibrella forsythiae]
MTGLIKITTDAQGVSVVSARELYSFLEGKARFNDWFKNRVYKYGLIEGQDFTLVTQSLVTNNPRNPTATVTDYALTLDTAKELAMVQNNEKGKQARQYFIDCEKQLRQIAEQSPDRSLAMDPVVLQLLQQQAQLLTHQQIQLDQLQQLMGSLHQVKGPDWHDASTRVRQPRPPVAPHQGPPRSDHWLTDSGNTAGLRQQINQRVNDYCDHYGVTQGNMYRWLYGRLREVYSLNVYALQQRSRESLLETIERYGYLGQLHSLTTELIINAHLR